MAAVKHAKTNGMKPFFKPASNMSETALPAGREIRHSFAAKMSIDANRKNTQFSKKLPARVS
jgi:hypothetical protein